MRAAGIRSQPRMRTSVIRSVGWAPIAAAVSACAPAAHDPSEPIPRAVPTSGPSTALATAAATAPLSESARPPPRASDLDLVVRCFTAAVEKLGWLPSGAHHGQFMRTALEAEGAAPECRALVDDGNKYDFAATGGRRVGWQPIGEKRSGDSATLQLRFTCTPECGTEVGHVILPLRWHCFSWVHRADHSSECHPTQGACDAARSRMEQGARMTTPCSLEPHAAWCIDAPYGRCLPEPWACDRELALFRSAFGPEARCIKKP